MRNHVVPQWRVRYGSCNRNQRRASESRLPCSWTSFIMKTCPGRSRQFRAGPACTIVALFRFLFFKCPRGQYWKEGEKDSKNNPICQKLLQEYSKSICLLWFTCCKLWDMCEKTEWVDNFSFENVKLTDVTTRQFQTSVNVVTLEKVFKTRHPFSFKPGMIATFYRLFNLSGEYSSLC